MIGADDAAFNDSSYTATDNVRRGLAVDTDNSDPFSDPATYTSGSSSRRMTRRRLLRALLDSQTASSNAVAFGSSRNHLNRPVDGSLLFLSARQIHRGIFTSDALMPAAGHSQRIESASEHHTHPSQADEYLDYNENLSVQSDLGTAAHSNASAPNQTRNRSGPLSHQLQSGQWMSMLQILGWLLIFRVNNALLVKTYFDPDEFWQSLEVAHSYVFGYGYLTWEWSLKIRGFAHPLLFAAVYKILQVLSLDDTFFLTIAPRIVQGCIAAIGDFFTFLLAYRLFGMATAFWTIAAVLLSWFNYFCLVRTYSNSLEACLTSIALYYWPWSRDEVQGNRPTRRNFRISLIFAALSCIVRPTSAILWIFLGTSLLFRKSIRIYAVVNDVLITMIAAIGVSSAIDFQFYQTWTFTPYEFLKLNVLQNIAEFYGGHPFHWYFTQGIPVVLLTLLPITVWGVLHTQYPRERECFWMCLWTVFCLSLQKHKEFRFLMPILPPLLVYAGHGLRVIEASDYVTDLVANSTAGDAEDDADNDEEYNNLDIDDIVSLRRRRPFSHAARERQQQNQSQRRSLRHPKTRPAKWLWKVLAVVGITNIATAFYLSRSHQRGIMEVMNWLRIELHGGKVSDILFLMPCHSTPFYSYLHRNIPMRFITCEPPIGVENRKGYQDETDVLYNNPLYFFQTYFDPRVGAKLLGWANTTSTSDFTDYSESPITPNISELPFVRRIEPITDAFSFLKSQTRGKYIDVPGQGYQILQHKWSSHIIMFDNPKLFSVVSSVLQGSGYSICARFFNSHFHDDPKRTGDVIVLCRRLVDLATG
ncbi:hypothetical protein BDV3_003923 [Batrachochytrium dendrobatidis]